MLDSVAGCTLAFTPSLPHSLSASSLSSSSSWFFSSSPRGSSRIGDGRMDIYELAGIGTSTSLPLSSSSSSPSSHHRHHRRHHRRHPSHRHRRHHHRHHHCQYRLPSGGRSEFQSGALRSGDAKVLLRSARGMPARFARAE
ncbi:MAG: hypothetical protein JWM47_4450 [Acidimicrobiales bacterium]|nr:hypothetical protein [Acidimicrobiales bacterium]